MSRFLSYSVLAASFLMMMIWSKPDHQPNMSPSDPPHVSGAARSLDLWTQSRAYPGGRIDADAWKQASIEYRQALAMNKTTTTNWESMGPHNIGGRTLRLTFNPQNPATLYAGSAAGGLWRSHSAGVGVSAWHFVPTGFPVLGVAAIAVHPTDTNVILIGTGELYNDGKTGNRINVRLSRGTYGTGILRSTDNGQTWTKPIDWAYTDLTGVQDIAFQPSNPNIALAATSEGIYRSTDAGLTWSVQSSVRMANDILFHPADPQQLLVSVGNLGSTGSGIYRSTDAGLTFSAVGSGLPAFSGKTTLSVTGSVPYVVYASVADSLSGLGVHKSTDFGTTWTQVIFTDYQTYQGWYSHDLAVNPWNRNEIVMGGIDVWTTQDAGTSILHASDWRDWYLYSTPPIGGPEGYPTYVHADIHHILYHPTDSNQIYFATDGGVFRSTDGGTTFEGLNGMLQTTQFYADFSTSVQDSNLAIGGLQDNASAVYQGSKAWYRVIGGDGCCAAIHPVVDDVIYASTQYSTIWFSNDRGLTFNYLNNQPPANDAPFVTSFALCQDDPITMYNCSDYVGVSGDGGNFWTPTNGGAPLNGNNVIRVAIADGSGCAQVYAAVAPGTNGRSALFVTTDGGGDWFNITGTLPDRYYHEIAVHPTNPDLAYVVLGGYGSDHVYKTTNRGATWLSVSTGLPDLPGNTITIDPLNPDHLYYGNDVGVYFSSDAGNSWAPYGFGLPEAVLAMDLSISESNRKLRLATHGSGVFQADLVGTGVGIPDPTTGSLHDLRIFPNPASEATVLSFALADANPVNFNVYDVAGNQIHAGLVNKKFEKGVHCLPISVEGWPAGIYFVKLETNGQKRTVRLAVIH